LVDSGGAVLLFVRLGAHGLEVLKAIGWGDGMDHQNWIASVVSVRPEAEMGRFGKQTVNV